MAATDNQVKDKDVECVNALLRDNELDMALQEDLEIHICLKCSATVVGLHKYVLHKLRECPKLTPVNGESTKAKENAGTAISVPHCSREPAESRSKRKSVEDVTSETCDFVISISNSPKQVKRIKKESDNFKASCSNSCLPSAPINNVVRCDPCDIAFDTKHGLVQHLVSPKHWSSSKDHPLHKSLILGYADALAPLAPYKCVICAFYFNHLTELLDHIVKEKEAHVRKMGMYRKFVCTFCKYRCWTNETLLKHLKNAAHKRGVSCLNPVTVSATSEICCSKCDWTCGREQALFAHMKWKHSGPSHADTSVVKQKFLIPAKENGTNLGIPKLKRNLASRAIAIAAPDNPKKEGKTYSRKSLNADKSNISRSKEQIANCEETESIVVPSSPSKNKTRNRRTKRKIEINDENNVENLQEEVSGTPEVEKDDKNESPKDGDFQISNKDMKGRKRKKLTQLCQHCNQAFCYKKELETHLMLLHPDKIFRCEPCCKIFVYEPLLKLHERSQLHRCTTKDMLDIEKGLLEPTEEFPCSRCLFRTATKAGIMFHEMMHDIEPAKLDEDNECSDTCDSENKDPECAAVTEGEIIVGNDEVILSADEIKQEIIVDSDGEVEQQESESKSDKENEVGEKVDENSLINSEVPEICAEIDEEIEAVNEDGGLKVNSEDEEEKLAEDKAEDAGEEFSSNKSKHGKPLHYSCPVCQKSFPPIKLRHHLCTHTGELAFKCYYCSEAFVKMGTLQSHIRSQHKEKKFACPHCPFRGRSKAKLDSHLETHEEERMRECLCEVCGAAFYNSAGIQAHMRVHKENKGRKYPCTFEGCNKKFRSPSEVVIHSSRHSNETRFLCETCGVATKTRKLLKRHEKVHLKFKNHKCQYCSYESIHAYHLQRHMRIHCLVKPYSCPYCPFTCNLGDNLRKHVLKSKRHEGLRVYPCRHCTFSCDLAEEMKNHTTKEHPEIAKQFDLDDPAFAMLVTKILNVEVDKRVPTEPPPPYIPRCEKRNFQKEKSVTAVEKPEGDAVILEEGIEVISVEQIDENNEMLEALENLMESAKVKRKPKRRNLPGKRARRNAAEKLADTLIENSNPYDGNQEIYTMFQDSVLVVIQAEEVPVEEQVVII